MHHQARCMGASREVYFLWSFADVELASGLESCKL